MLIQTTNSLFWKYNKCVIRGQSSNMLHYVSLDITNAQNKIISHIVIYIQYIERIAFNSY